MTDEMLPDTPHHRYFLAKEGHWRGKIRFELTDRRGLRASSLRPADQWTLKTLSLASRLSGLVLRTTVDCRADPNKVLHTTCVTNWGIPVYRSAETIFLVKDGHTFRVEGRESFFPFFRSADWAASGAVATDYDGATYTIPCFGLTMEQRTRMTAEGLVITQITEFSQAIILLKWQRPLDSRPAADQVK